ncbi:hypothetical protein BT93_J1857 [Corymbia citriodora subsp. variegata]|nr:hypothetical protein BT93_J1857 [Corymbia citriodora subsp. variegata]
MCVLHVLFVILHLLLFAFVDRQGLPSKWALVDRQGLPLKWGQIAR